MGVLTNFAKFTGKHLPRSLFFNMKSYIGVKMFGISSHSISFIILSVWPKYHFNTILTFAVVRKFACKGLNHKLPSAITSSKLTIQTLEQGVKLLASF